MDIVLWTFATRKIPHRVFQDRPSLYFATQNYDTTFSFFLDMNSWHTIMKNLDVKLFEERKKEKVDPRVSLFRAETEI